MEDSKQLIFSYNQPVKPLQRFIQKPFLIINHLKPDYSFYCCIFVY